MTEVEAAELLLSQRPAWVKCSECGGRFHIQHCPSCKNSGVLPDSEMWRAHEILELDYPPAPSLDWVNTGVSIDHKDPSCVHLTYEAQLKEKMNLITMEFKI